MTNNFYSLSNITRTLKAYGVPAKFVSVGAFEERAAVYVLVHQVKGNHLFRLQFTAQQLMGAHEEVETELRKAACWFHGGSIPSQRTWWQRQTTSERFIWFWAFGFALFVILSLVKHFGLYK